MGRVKWLAPYFIKEVLSVSTLTHESTEWKGSAEQTIIKQTYSFDTANKYVDKNIKVDVNVPGMNLYENQTFYINDGINTWTWSIDDSGNVLIL